MGPQRARDAFLEGHPWIPLRLIERIYPPSVIFIPLAGVLIAVSRITRAPVMWVALTSFLVMYTSVGLGLTLGFHRLLAHAAFGAPKWMRYTLAVLGTMSGQGLFFNWIADHRLHHVCTDCPGDPHSPHWSDRQELSGLQGLLHAHMGWMFGPRRAGLDRLIPDLVSDSGMRAIDHYSALLVVLGLALPGVVVVLLGGSTEFVVQALLWGGPVRMFVLNHTTWSVNSIGHSHGAQHFASDDESRDHPVLAFLAFGDGWHNGHHAFPKSARHGLLQGQWDSGYGVIRLLERLGLVWDVYLPHADRVRRKLVPDVRRTVSVDLPSSHSQRCLAEAE